MNRSDDRKHTGKSQKNEAGEHLHLDALVSGIEQDAKQDAERILEEARKEAERRLLYAEKQAESIVREASEKAAEQVERIHAQRLSGVTIDAKRRSMRIRDEIFDQVMSRTRERLKSLVEGKDYSEVLLNLMVEAVMGLDAHVVKVNGSETERKIITQKLLDEVERRVKSLAGRKIRLELSEESPLQGLGVVLTSDDGRTAYNNQLETRMKRLSSDARRIIYDRVIGDTRSGLGQADPGEDGEGTD
jgi:V/A-type H+-transporting ATPase subunit E